MLDYCSTLLHAVHWVGGLLSCACCLLFGTRIKQWSHCLLWLFGSSQLTGLHPSQLTERFGVSLHGPGSAAAFITRSPSLLWRSPLSQSVLPSPSCSSYLSQWWLPCTSPCEHFAVCFRLPWSSLSRLFILALETQYSGLPIPYPCCTPWGNSLLEPVTFCSLVPVAGWVPY